MVTYPTHFSHNDTPSLIGLVFVSSPDGVTSCTTVAPLANSDHLDILLVYHFPHVKKSPNSNSREVWLYSKGGFERACEMLDSINWDKIVDEGNINCCWKNWQNTFLTIMSQCIPIKRKLSKKEHLPWISNSLLKAIKMRNSLFKAFKLIQYKISRNRIAKEIRKAKMRLC